MALSPKLKAFEDAFDVLNSQYFESALSKPVITMSPTPGAFGHFTPWKSWKDAEGEHYEINLGAATLDRPLPEMIGTLLHEMVHQYCEENHIKDTSRGNTYHNKEFKRECEKRQLIVKHDKRVGWGVTEPSPGLVDFVNSGRFEKCKQELHRLGESMTKDPSDKKKSSSTRKYVCPGCGMSVRATREVNIGCLDCDMQMETE